MFTERRNDLIQHEFERISKHTEDLGDLSEAIHLLIDINHQ
jgi:hypothetical protein